jgi:hypothetical protein
VAPYAVMAAVNLLANILMHTYDSLYLVENDVMAEIQERFNLQFEGVVDRVQLKQSTTLVPLQLDGRDKSQSYTSGFSDFVDGMRLENMNPDVAVEQCRLPSKLVTTYPMTSIEMKSKPSVDWITT